MVGGGARGLDIRRGLDVEQTEDDEIVGPGSGGLSTAPDNPRLLQRHRRPESLGGTGKHPVWMIEQTMLPGLGLGSRRDKPNHEIVEADEKVTLGVYIARIHATVSHWAIAHE